MNLIKHKLQSKRGASMLIAMVFMVFAIFVGGSVLAAASANGYRIEHHSDQQDYLNQRSAALLLADEMDIAAQADISLEVKDQTITHQKVIISEAGVETNNGEATVTHQLVFEANNDGKVDALRRVMFETAILRYLVQNSVADEMPIVIDDLVYDDGSADGEKITSIDQFWTTDRDMCAGSIHITGTKSGSTFADYTARYRSGTDEELYNFIIDFGDYSQLTVTMNGFSGTQNQTGFPQYENISMVGDKQHATRVDVEALRTSISWKKPVIAKGGAE